MQEIEDDEELYDADIEVIEPDEYEEPECEDDSNGTTSSTESPIDEKDSLPRDVIRGLRKLDCESQSTASSHPGSSHSKRKREDDLTFFRSKQIRSRSPTPLVEIEEAASDEPSHMVRRRLKIKSRKSRPLQSMSSPLAKESRDIHSWPNSVPSSPIAHQSYPNGTDDMDVDQDT